MQNDRITFTYLNKFLYYLIIALGCVIWLLLALGVTKIATGSAHISLYEMQGIITMAGFLLFGGAASIVALLKKSEVKIALHYKKYVIPYNRIKKLRFYSYRFKKGMIIKTKLLKRLDIRDANYRTESVFFFYSQLKKRI